MNENDIHNKDFALRAVVNVINDDCVRLKSIARRGIPRCSLMQLLDLKITSDNLMDPMFCSAQTFYQASRYYDLSKKKEFLYTSCIFTIL